MVDALSKDQNMGVGQGADATTAATEPVRRPDSLPSKSVTYDDGKLWSFLRDVLSQGGDIWIDYQKTSHAAYSVRLDTAAIERVAKLKELLQQFETNGWHAIDPNRPPSGTVLIAMPNGWVTAADYGAGFWWQHGRALSSRPTHFQSLPAPPTQLKATALCRHKDCKNSPEYGEPYCLEHL